MIIFESHSPTSKDSPIVLLLGTGLIGSQVSASLRRWSFRPSWECTLNWTDPVSLSRDLARAASGVSDLASAQAAPIKIAWCAGSGSLGSTDAQLLSERRAFQEVLEMSLDLSSEHAVGFHFVSSAGALFEGQRCVDLNSHPEPRTRYGQMKLEQEGQLAVAGERFALGTRIYRPSTVYGSHEFHRRSGLISHIMWNAIRSEATPLEANVHALRDFVYHVDVGRHIARMLLQSRREGPRLHHLATGKPSSILEVFRHIERLLGRSLSYRLNPAGVNNANITFSARGLPPGWAPVPLEVGLKAVWRDTRNSFLLDRFGEAAA